VQVPKVLLYCGHSIAPRRAGALCIRCALREMAPSLLAWWRLFCLCHTVVRVCALVFGCRNDVHSVLVAREGRGTSRGTRMSGESIFSRLQTHTACTGAPEACTHVFTVGKYMHVFE
jgi:hypothetical protein